MEDAVIKQVLENAKVEIPSGMVESEIDENKIILKTTYTYQGLKHRKYLEICTSI